MAHRWEAPAGRPSDSADETPARDQGALPAEAVESWRTWLLTGHAAAVSDRRRMRGSHRGIKQMLVEGNAAEMPQSWKHFSGAMVRLAINDALNALPKDQTLVVWLAYFGGLSNRDIAKRLGMSVGAVQRKLNAAFDNLGEYVEHGRTAGRRALFAVLAWLSVRRVADALQHPVSAAAVAAHAAVLVLVVATAQPVTTPVTRPVTTPFATAAPAELSAISPDAAPRADAVTQTVDASLKKVTSKVAAGIPVPSLPPVPPLPSPPPPPPLPNP